jgi:hypothetical protein
MKTRYFFHYYELIFKFYIVKLGFQIDFLKCKQLLKLTFYNVTFVSSMCQTYSTKKKVKFIYFPSFQYTIIFML